MQQLLIATMNKGKRVEFQELLKDAQVQLVTPADLGLQLEVDETGSTYAENAALKASAFCKASGLPALADDSGLEVDALDGAPGLYSARYSKIPGATDRDRRVYLLQQLNLSKVPQPWTARFRCVIAVAFPGEEVVFAEGFCEGQIISEERGNNGFGYDPVFFIPEMKCTMAELSSIEKNRISHRARAVAKSRLLIQAGFAQ